MKYRVTFFSFFLSLVVSLIAGCYKYSLVTNILFYFSFFFLVLFSYRIYLLFERLGVFLYEKYIKKIIEEIKTGKKTIREE